MSMFGLEGGGLRGGGVGGSYQPGVYVPLKALFLVFEGSCRILTAVRSELRYPCITQGNTRGKSSKKGN